MSEHVLPAEEPIRFVAPVIQDNPTGWGPCEMPDQFRDMPYQPFSKGDRLGKISDWTVVQDKKYQNKYASQFGAGSSYAYYHDEDESTFHLVDTTRVQKPPYQRGRARGQRGRGQRGARTPGGMTTLSKVPKNQRDRKLGKRWGQRGAPMKIRDASVTVRPTWATIEDMDFPRLAKLSLPGIKEGEDIACCGTLEYYDKAYDRVNVKHEKQLQRIDRIFHTVTTTDDPVIRRLSKATGTVYATDAILATIMCCTRSNYSWDIVIEKIGDKLFFDKRDNTEFDLLTVNETSVEPPTDDGNSINSPRNLALEATFINHNFSQQVLKSGPNEPKYKFPEPNPFVSEEEDGEVASVGYRYRKWNLNNGVVLAALSFFARGSYQRSVATSFVHNMSQPALCNSLEEVTNVLSSGLILAKHIQFPTQRERRERIMTDFMNMTGMPGTIGCIDGTHIAVVRPDEHEAAYYNRKGYHSLNVIVVLVARCEHDAVMQGPQNETQFLSIKALNEWDSKVANGVEWRQKLDTQRGAVLANELRNNSCKLAKWTVQALLAGSDQIKFGYVSRSQVRDNSRHVILGTQQFKPHEFAAQINLSMDNAWGILRCIIDICMKQKDGKYLIMKDPNKPLIRLYDIPDNTFESDASEESGDEPADTPFAPLYSYGSNKRI